jgi:hypothetical protein
MNEETKEQIITFLKNNWFKLTILVWLFLALILSVSGEIIVRDGTENDSRSESLLERR